jgi:hypothetical protein
MSLGLHRRLRQRYVAEDEGNDSNGSISVSEPSGEELETGGVDSAGEEDGETEEVLIDL